MQLTTVRAMQIGFGSTLAAFAYLLFILLYMPCVATIGVIYKEIGGRKADLAYFHIKHAIVLHQFKPDSQLLEQSLARELGCSQGTTREALLRLADDGLVTRRAYQGTFVTRTSLAEVCEMVRVRLSIERRAARMIDAGRIEGARDDFERLLTAMDKAHVDQDYFQGSELDRAFHAEIARVAGLGLLSPVLQRCALHIHRFTLSSIEVPREFSQEAGIGTEHRALLEDLAQASPDKAEASIVGHLERVLKQWAPSIFEAIGAEEFAPTHQ